VVWLWGRRLFGEWGALAAVFLFTNCPPVLAHAGLATMDMTIGAAVVTALYTFTRWLEQPDWKRSVAFGIGLGMALVAKFSSFLLMPVCLLTLTLLYRPKLRGRNWAWVLVAFLTVWATYRFSFGTMTEHVARDAAEQGGLVSKVPQGLLHLVESTPLPAPQVLDGLWQVHNHVDGGHTAYLHGQHSFHGWWYFFPVAIAVKTPLGLLLLALIGATVRKARIPAVLCGVILLINLPTSLNIGVRYMLPLYPLLALLAAGGAMWLWQRQRLVAAILLIWVAISAAAAHPDYIAYFNELSGNHPEQILVDSDLDWGQDMNRLVAELKRRRVDYLHMACLYTGDDTRLGLPNWDGLEPYQPVKGWVAVSQTMLRNYGWMVAQQQGRADLAFAWLDRYKPVARVGRSILLYRID
jgi:4-amino-4-deoxy-L-arabinose transferase-like glycosyltransferase